MKNMKLSTKLLTAFLAVGVIPASVIGLLALNKSSNALESQSYNQLVGMRDVKKAQIEQFFNERQGDMGVLVENVNVLRQEAFKKLESIQELKSASIEKLLADMRIVAAGGASSRENSDFFNDFKAYHDQTNTKADEPMNVSTPEYDKIWRQCDRFMSRYVEKFGYYDVFMICAKHGHVVYSHAKESDLGANVGAGPLRDEGLGRIWKRVMDTGQVAVADFAPYSPSNGDYAAFMGAPIKDDSGNIIAVFALQLPTDPINEIVQSRSGMGVTGETYLVGKNDGRTSFRSDLLTMGNGKYVVGYEISTEYIDKALSSKDAEFQEVFTDSSGKLVMVVADSLHIDGLHWACISKLNLEEAVSQKLDGESEDFLTRYNNMYGYYDLFLIAPNGHVFYSVCREADYDTNLVNGKYAGSNLGKLVRSVLDSRQFALADFEPYAPSNGAPAAFIAQPVMNNGKVELVVALQLSLEAINRIMQQRAGMGQTGETYLVGPDKRMRSDSFLDSEGHSVKASFAGTIQKNGCDTEAARQALAGTTDAKVIMDYNGNPVLSAYTPVEVGETTWALLAEIDRTEAFAARDAIVWMMTIVSAIAVVSIIVLAVLITRSITKPINTIIAGLTEGAEQVAAASGQVSAASQSLAEGATEQAAGLEETSSSLEEMSSMTKQNADNAQQANSYSEEARHAADGGSKSMQRMSDAINEIQRSSNETAKIIKVIDEIAFQTNLLALNAAVEAARAGEAGKGFAVVAEEVRNLAMRSAEAARNTSDMIQESTKNSQQGVEIAQEVAKSLEDIVDKVTKTTSLVGEITAASKEQAQGVEQVNTAVSQMDKVTQQNAANAEESASASEELSAQAEQMNMMVQQLVGLVEGSAGRQQGFSHKPAAKKTSSQKSKSLSHSDAIYHEIAKGSGEPQRNRHEAKASASIEKEFGEFNS